jgi:hypothetical protein
MLPAQQVSFPLRFTGTWDALRMILDRTRAKNPNSPAPIGPLVDLQNVIVRLSVPATSLFPSCLKWFKSNSFSNIEKINVCELGRMRGYFRKRRGI